MQSATAPKAAPEAAADVELVRRALSRDDVAVRAIIKANNRRLYRLARGILRKTRLHRARTMLRDNVERKIGPVVMDAFPFAGRRCDRLTDAVLTRLGYL
jgi:hypothetical protein